MTDEVKKMIDGLKSFTITNNGVKLENTDWVKKSDVIELIEKLTNPKAKDMATIDLNDNCYQDKC